MAAHGAAPAKHCELVSGCFAYQAAYQAEFFQSNFKADKGLDWEEGSTSSRTGSEASLGEFKNVTEEMRLKLYYA